MCTSVCLSGWLVMCDVCLNGLADAPSNSSKMNAKRHTKTKAIVAQLNTARTRLALCARGRQRSIWQQKRKNCGIVCRHHRNSETLHASDLRCHFHFSDFLN